MKHTLTEAIARIETLEAAAEKSTAITGELLKRTHQLREEAERRALITAALETRIERLEASAAESAETAAPTPEPEGARQDSTGRPHARP